MTDIATLARRRAAAAAHLEALARFDESADTQERAAFRRALVAYQKAEEAYQKVASMLTTEELAELAVVPDRAA